MRVAALYDVHSNVQALDAVLAEVAADAIVFGGDVVRGPFPRETLERIRALDGAHVVRGNCEREVAGDRAELDPELEEVTAWCAQQLSREDLDWLASLPPTVSLDGVLYCHATPRSDTECVTTLTPEHELRELLGGVEEDVVVCGHTHVQFDRGRLVNAGSVGWPWDDERGAYWALLGDGVELRRTDYDVEATAAAVRAADFPFPRLADDLVRPRGAAATMRRFEDAR